MFNNLRTALYRKGISAKQYAEILGVGEKTVQNKLVGKTDFTYLCVVLLTSVEYTHKDIFCFRLLKKNIALKFRHQADQPHPRI